MHGSESGMGEVHSSWWYPSVQKHGVKILHNMFRESRVVHGGQGGQYARVRWVKKSVKDLYFPPLKFGSYVSI